MAVVWPMPLASPVTAPGAEYAVVLASSETEPPLPLAVARSGLPSPFRSPIATERGLMPVGKSTFASKLPSPSPGRTETVSGVLALAVAKSGLPSPFRSPIATV